MRTYKANLPEGVKKQFSALRGVKVKLINKKNCKKKAKKYLDYLLLNCGALRAALSPGFLRSLLLESLVINPALFSIFL